MDILQAKKNTNELPPYTGLNKLHKFLTQYRRTTPRVGTTQDIWGTRTTKHKQNRPATPPKVRRETRSTKTYDHYEGELTNYDPINRLYQIKYLDGDTEEFTPTEMKQYYHQSQRYSQNAEANAAGGTLWDPELNKMCH